ncbi:Solute Carrier Family 15 Member 3 [Manis pentadactyla]|nr:Solute Carrier Family 15 Member 3 [Manis pentadactyla]
MSSQVTSMLTLRVQVKGPWLATLQLMVSFQGYVIDKGYGVDRDTFRFASYSDTLKLTMSSQVTSMLTLRVQVKGPWLATLQLMVSFQGYVIDKGYGVDRDTFRFASYSDTLKLTMSSQVTSMLTLRVQVKGPWLATLQLMVSFQGYVIDKGYGVDRDTFRFASYSDTLKLTMSSQVTSMLTLRVQVKGPWLATLQLMVSFQGYVIDKGYGVDRDTFRFASYSDVRAKARLIFIIVV